ncbi:MAG: MarR family transcriptional regulator [Asticcacaulis sp.]|uniref:MarR family winged helix-turn-helix transcriptional regulator n=1 Tax=Asticcacaulis sp. TaxID=1872648 RepID=UPI0039E31713
MTEDAARIQNYATRFLRRARVLEEGSQLTSAQYCALSTLNSHPALSLTELAELERVAHPTMSRIVSGLMRNGLIERQPDAHDRRTHRLSLSPAGKSTYEAIYARRLVLIDALLKQLKPETVADLMQALDRLQVMMADKPRS